MIRNTLHDHTYSMAMMNMLKHQALLFAVFAIAIILVSPNITQLANSTTLNNLFGGNKPSNNTISVVSQTAYIDSIGSFHVVGEVANTSNQTVRSVQITASIYDPSHVIIGTATGYSDVDTLAPGERSPFHLLSSGLSQAGRIGTYQLSTSSQPAFGEQKPAFLRLTIGRAYVDSINTYHVIGEVTNEANGIANFVEVSAAFYGYNHQIIGEGTSSLTTISPAQTMPFEMIVQSVPNQQIVYASYNVQSQEYSMIGGSNSNGPSKNIPPQASSSSSNTQPTSPSASMAVSENQTGVTTNTTNAKTEVALLVIPQGASFQGNPSYDPNPITIKKGDTLQVINKDQTPHTVTSGKGMFLLGKEDPEKGKLFDTSIISPGSSAQISTANLKPGTIPFHCQLHPYMIGTLVISP